MQNSSPPLHGISVLCPLHASMYLLHTLYGIPVQYQFHTPMCHSVTFLFCALPLGHSCSMPLHTRPWHSCSVPPPWHSWSTHFSITFLFCTPLHSHFAPLVSPCLSVFPVTIFRTLSASLHAPLHSSTPLFVPHPSMPLCSPPHLFMPHCTPSTPLRGTEEL